MLNATEIPWVVVVSVSERRETAWEASAYLVYLYKVSAPSLREVFDLRDIIKTDYRLIPANQMLVRLCVQDRFLSTLGDEEHPKTHQP